MATNATQNPTTTPPPSSFPSTGTGTQPGQQSQPNKDKDQQNKQQGQRFGDEQQQREGPVARRIEEKTSKIPSDVFLWAAVGAMASSLVLRASQKKHASLLFGEWVSPLLLFGVYNKLVKIGGSDRFNNGGNFNRSENYAR